ncbi:MAG: alpha-L-glutamate ligase-like protein [Bacteriovoracaceae bacterium]|nr:alpha-L-glutamate ligase-like protein [Bacteriovoracaceae bacterium]
MIFSQLRELGILGINNRIGRYILRHNKRSSYPLVDDKVKTAARAEAWGVPMPENYFAISSFGDLKNFPHQISKLSSFVIKPANGSQGNGIVVISEVIKDESGWITFKRSSGRIMEMDEIRHHISGILSGLYSLSGLPDTAIIQQKIDMHPVFNDYCYGGIPDVRVIVHEGFPVMSMVRLPTKDSDGKANLHQGAIGAGINLKDGTTHHAVIKNQMVEVHPDTGHRLDGLKLPHWQEVLELAARCYDMVGLGYLGVDIVLTPDHGPILLELNARPGLAIQIANVAGLVPRLERVAQEVSKGLTAKERVTFSQTHF